MFCRQVVIILKLMNTADTKSGKEPIRLFQSDIFEFFTHIHPAAVAAVYLPLIVSSGFLTGYLLFDMLHYAMHHFNIKNGTCRRSGATTCATTP